MKKGLAAELVMKLPPPDKLKSKGKPEAESDDSDDVGMESAGNEAVAAMKKGDGKAFAEAVKTIVEMC